LASVATVGPTVPNSSSQPTSNSYFPNDSATEKILAKWDPDIRRASNAAQKSFHTRASVADDFAQDARVKVLRAHQQSPQSTDRYVRKVISNAVHNSIRRERPHLEHESRLSELTPSGNDGLGNKDTCRMHAPVSEMPDPFVQHFVATWVASLPPHLQRIYELLYVNDFTQREAAVVLGVSQPRVFELNAELLRRGKEALAPVAK